MYYLELLSTTITNFRPSALNHNPTEAFIEQLYYINFNSWRFFDYLAQKIQHQTTLNTNIETKIKTLALEFKKVRQYKTRKDIKYNPSQKSAGKFISQWIDEEISYLEKQKQNSAYSILSEGNADTAKIQFDLSVPQVACLFKIMHDVKIITNQNIAQLTEVIAHNITTKKTESVSPGSLRGKFIAVEEPALDSIKSLLIQMINQITKIQAVLLFFFLDDLVSVYQQVSSFIDF
ncbi:MAG: hypothetical protein Q8928_17730 [Bacteroidota bacterium]|nr:hypothetical protein [Bacteroidota bacterium]